MRVKVLERFIPGGYLKVKEAAKELNISERTLRNYLSAGIFTTYKFYSLTFVSWDEISERLYGRTPRAGVDYY